MSSSAGTAVGSSSFPPTCGSGDAGGGPEEAEEDNGPFEAEEAPPGAGSGPADSDSTGTLTRTVSSLSLGAIAGGGRGGGKAVPPGSFFLSGFRTQSSL